MLYKRKASPAFLISKSCNKHKDVLWVGQCHKPFNSKLGIELSLSLRIFSLFETWFRRLHLWLWSSRKILGGITKITWESKLRKLGAQNPINIWLKEVTDVQGVKEWFWAESLFNVFLTLSLAVGSWKHRLHVSMNSSGVQVCGSCCSG